MLLLRSHKAAYLFLSATFLSAYIAFVFLLQSYKTILTWLAGNLWCEAWDWQFISCFFPNHRPVNHLVPSSWRDAISLGWSNFYSVLVILLATSLCLVSTDNVSIITGNLVKVFIQPYGPPWSRGYSSFLLFYLFTLWYHFFSPFI